MSEHIEIGKVELSRQEWDTIPLDTKLALTTYFILLSEQLTQCVADNQILIERIKYLENKLSFCES
jgi:hypothetical protein